MSVAHIALSLLLRLVHAILSSVSSRAELSLFDATRHAEDVQTDPTIPISVQNMLAIVAAVNAENAAKARAEKWAWWESAVKSAAEKLGTVLGTVGRYTMGWFDAAVVAFAVAIYRPDWLAAVAVKFMRAAAEAGQVAGA